MAASTSHSPHQPAPAGTLVSNGSSSSRWGPFDPAAVTFEGDSDRVLASRHVELVASGFRWTEGPTWLPRQELLLFSDTIDARIYQWTEKDGVEVLVHDSGGFDGTNVEAYATLFEPGSNGMAATGDDLYVCQHPTHRVVRTKLSSITKGSKWCELEFETLADSFEGARLNSPNDLVLGPDDSVWFTDPVYGFLLKQPDSVFPVVGTNQDTHNPTDLPYLDEACDAGIGFKGVYRWSNGELRLVTDVHSRPNGLAFSPDFETLWVANSSAVAPSWTAYRVTADLPLQPWYSVTEQDLGKMPGPGVSDGFKVDAQGLIWSSMPSGVIVFEPREKKVVCRVLLNTNVSNIQFGKGGDVWITGLGHLWRLQRKIS